MSQESCRLPRGPLRASLASALLLALAVAGAHAAEGAAGAYSGADLYQLNCANCHGVYGEGDGAVTPGLSVVLLDLRYLSERNAGAFPEDFVRSIIDGRLTRAAHGPEGMPIWGVEFTRQEGLDETAEARVAAKIDALVGYLEAMQLSE
jgi:mono/diheme cytochrome c family protein